MTIKKVGKKTDSLPQQPLIDSLKFFIYISRSTANVNVQFLFRQSCVMILKGIASLSCLRVGRDRGVKIM